MKETYTNCALIRLRLRRAPNQTDLTRAIANGVLQFDPEDDEILLRLAAEEAGITFRYLFEGIDTFNPPTRYGVPQVSEADWQEAFETVNEITEIETALKHKGDNNE